jgi:hypothetical protein
MSESENRLLSLLFEEGRVLKNLKFFPGPECSSADQLFDAAHAAISAGLRAGEEDMIPVESVKAQSIGELVNSF